MTRSGVFRAQLDGLRVQQCATILDRDRVFGANYSLLQREKKFSPVAAIRWGSRDGAILIKIF